MSSDPLLRAQNEGFCVSPIHSRGSRLHQASLQRWKTEAGALLAPSSSYPLPLCLENLPSHSQGGEHPCLPLDFSLPRQLVLASRMRQVDGMLLQNPCFKKTLGVRQKDSERERGSDWLWENSILQTQLDCCTLELRQRQHTHSLHGFNWTTAHMNSETMSVHTWPAQVPARLCSSTERGK